MILERMAENLGLETEEFFEIFDLYVETTSIDLAALEGAVANADFDTAHKKAHSIKGASGNMGIDELFKLAKAIDDLVREGSLSGVDDLLTNFKDSYEGLKQDFRKRREGWA